MYTDKFGRDQVKESYYRHQMDVKEMLDSQALKNYFYYTNDQIGILRFLNEKLGKMIKDGLVKELMPRVYINEIPRMVKRLAMVYKTRPERVYNKTLSDDQADILGQTYKHYKEFHRQAKLLNTILVKPTIRNDKFYYEILGRHFATVIPNEEDFNAMDELWYYKAVKDKDGNETFVRVHWDAERFWITDENDERIRASEYPSIQIIEQDNPYKRIPFAILRLQSSNDFWGDGMSDAVNLNEQNNAKLCDTYYKLWMSFGYPIGVNLNVKAESFDISPYKPIMVDNLRTDQQPPSLSFATPNHEIQQDTETFDYTRKISATSKGLPVSGFVTEETLLSGYAKQIDNMELIENNEDDKESLISFEKDLFELMVMESELTSSKIKLSGLELDSIDFKPYEFPKSIDEQNKEKEFEYKYNISTPLDWMRDKYPDYSDDELKQILKDNRMIKIELGDSRQTMFERVNGNRPPTT